jgi:hypothetical protein
MLIRLDPVRIKSVRLVLKVLSKDIERKIEKKLKKAKEPGMEAFHYLLLA